MDLIYQETPAIKNQFVTFGSFNNTAKLNDRVIQIWSKILKNVENSKIFLKNYLFEDKEIKRTLIKKFKHNGINENRIGFSFGHISNAKIGNKNPGVEIFSISYQIAY